MLTLYKIADPFFRFWYRFVPGNMMSISAGAVARNYDAAIGSYLSSYMGPVFEDICRQYLIYYACLNSLIIYAVLIPDSPQPGRKNDQPRITKPLVVRGLVSYTLMFLKVKPYWKP